MRRLSSSGTALYDLFSFDGEHIEALLIPAQEPFLISTELDRRRMNVGTLDQPSFWPIPQSQLAIKISEPFPCPAEDEVIGKRRRGWDFDRLGFRCPWRFGIEKSRLDGIAGIAAPIKKNASTQRVKDRLTQKDGMFSGWQRLEAQNPFFFQALDLGTKVC